MTPTDYSQQGRCCHLYIGPTVVTCLEIRWPPGFWFSGPAPSHYSQPRAGRSATECELGRVRSALAGTPIADYSLPAAGAHPRVEARRLSIRRRADFGRCRAPVQSAPAMCCLWVMNTTRHVSGVSRSLPLLRWPGQISGPESWPTLGVWHHAIRWVLVRRPGTTSYRGRPSVCAPPGPTAALRSRGRLRA